MGSTAPAEQTIPHKVKPLKGKKIVQLVSGYMFSLVLTQNDGLYSWGYNIFGNSYEEMMFMCFKANLGMELMLIVILLYK